MQFFGTAESREQSKLQNYTVFFIRIKFIRIPRLKIASK